MEAEVECLHADFLALVLPGETERLGRGGGGNPGGSVRGDSSV